MRLNQPNELLKAQYKKTVLFEKQLAGKGRKGQWQSARGLNLTFNLLMTM
jgi:biotin-(acetyl-CoA carboxylase) ligase